ncbi:MAG: hypothetical protein QNJ47_03015 [Nostocaceae cyanobacterium]|nr:hypothetical protein [Nostocaceae cyanobacterium]
MTVASAKVLRSQILKCLTEACNDGILKTKINEIYKLLKFDEAKTHGKKIKNLMGGELNFKRRKELAHFERFDGAWFDFGILIDETDKPAKIIGFHFEIRFLEDNPIKFLRFDLNLPEHNNQDKGKRFHIHPGCDDFMIHSPPMSPLEILHLFLYDLYLPTRPRSS